MSAHLLKSELAENLL